jgi:hypothetical protein
MTSKQPATTTIVIDGGQQIITELLSDQYGTLERGEARTALENALGVDNVWSEDEFGAAFTAVHFDSPYVRVVRNADQQTGNVLYVDKPRFYFSFQADTGSTPNDAGITP